MKSTRSPEPSTWILSIYCRKDLRTIDKLSWLAPFWTLLERAILRGVSLEDKYFSFKKMICSLGEETSCGLVCGRASNHEVNWRESQEFCTIERNRAVVASIPWFGSDEADQCCSFGKLSNVLGKRLGILKKYR